MSGDEELPENTIVSEDEDVSASNHAETPNATHTDGASKTDDGAKTNDGTTTGETTTDDETNTSGDAGLTPEELAEAKSYHFQEFVWDLVDRAVDVTYLAVAAFVLAVPLDTWLQGYLASAWLRVGGMFLVVTLLHMAVSLPFSFYSGHVLEHRFGMSKLSFGGWLGRYLQRNLLSIIFGVVVVELLFALVWWSGPWWWLAAAVAFFFFSVVLGQLAPILIMPLFYKIEPLEDSDLGERFERLSKGTGLTIEGVFRMDLSSETVKANAMLAGLGSTRRVILGDTLLNDFSPEEIEVVIAHEIGHHAHAHVSKLIAVGMVLSGVGFLATDLVLRGSFSLSSGEDYAALPVAALPLVLLSITVVSQLMEPIQNFISRHFERQADRYALDKTGDVTSFRSAFEKLARMNKAHPDPHPLEVFLFHSHPPIAQRLQMAGDARDQ